MKRMSTALKIKRVKAHYSKMFPLNVDKKTLTAIKEQLKKEDFNHNTIFFSEADILKPVILFCFMSLPKFHHYLFMNAYRLLDIYLGNDEEYLSVSAVDSEITVLSLGYSEFLNKRQGDVIEQFIEQQIMRDKLVWIFYRGKVNNFIQMYASLNGLLNIRKFKRIFLGSNSVKEVEEF